MESVVENLPTGWATATVAELCEINPKHDRELPDSTEVSFVPMRGVSAVSGEIQEFEIRPLGKVRKGYTHFAENDVIWAKITPCMENGKSAISKGLHNSLACGSTEFYVLRSQGGIISVYLHQYIRQKQYRARAKMAMTGAVGQQRVPKNFILNTNIPLPPLPEQKRIADRIDALQAKSKKAREALEAARPLLDKLRQSILVSAFRGGLTADWRARNPDVEPASVLLERIRKERRRKWEEAELAKMRAKGKEPKNDKWKERYKEPEPVDTTGLPELPEGWCWTTVKHIVQDARIGLVRSTREQSVKNGVPYVRMGHYDAAGSWNFKNITSVEVTPDELSTYELKNNDVLFNTRNSYELVEKTSIWPEEKPGHVYNNNLIRMRFLSTVHPAWIAYQMQSPFFLGRLLQSKSATTNVCAIYTRDLMKQLLAIPSWKEQKLIVKRIDHALDRANRAKTIVDTANVQINQFDQSILAKAFRGEIVPQDPNDEPASVLLERIRTEREALKPKKKTTRRRKKTA